MPDEERKNVLDHPTLMQVKSAMERAFDTEAFPADKAKLAHMAGPEQVGRVPLVKFVEGLPDRRYHTLQEVEQTLEGRWRDLYSLRDAGWEGAPGER